MSGAQHTAGPWSAETPMGESAPIIVPAGLQAYEWGEENIIATLGSTLEDLPPRSAAQRRMDANARLIAAAPDLLEALLLAHGALSGANMDMRAVEAKTRAAIAKALGQ